MLGIERIQRTASCGTMKSCSCHPLAAQHMHERNLCRRKEPSHTKITQRSGFDHLITRCTECCTSINTAHFQGGSSPPKAGCSSLHLKMILCITQHTFSPAGQSLSHLSSNRTYGLVLHKVFIHQVTDTQANCQIAREEGTRHWFPPEFPCNDLLIKDLTNGAMHNEHRKC